MARSQTCIVLSNIFDLRKRLEMTSDNYSVLVLNVLEKHHVQHITDDGTDHQCQYLPHGVCAVYEHLRNLRDDPSEGLHH